MPVIDYEKALVRVQACWRGVSSGDSVYDPDALRPEDNLFQYGVDSLLFIRLVRAVESDLELKLPLVQIFEEPRLATIARAVAHVSR